MSAGAVPVVIDAGGQPEIVTDGVDGLLFHTSDELVERTVSLVGDRPRREELAAAAARSARRFSLPAFAERLHGIVDGLFPSVGGPAGPPTGHEAP